MRFRVALKTLDTKTNDELLLLFDRAAFTLGFSSLGMRTEELLDTETAIVLLAYVLGKHELRLARFVPVLVMWLSRYHSLLNAQKLSKMAREMESAVGELAIFRLVALALKASDPRKFRNFRILPLTEPFYLEPRLRSLVDQKLKDQGFYPGLSKETGLMISASAFAARESDLVPEHTLFRRNEQLRHRLIHGATYRSDATLLLRDRPQMTAKELADTLMLSYEPAHRLSADIARYRALGFALGNEASS